MIAQHLIPTYGSGAPHSAERRPLDSRIEDNERGWEANRGR